MSSALLPQRTTKLEPLGSTFIIATLIHAALGLGVWWWAHQKDVFKGLGTDPNIVWSDPADFQSVQQEMPTSLADLDLAAPKALPPPAPAAAPAKAIEVTPEMLAEILGKEQAAAMMKPAAAAVVAPMPAPPPAVEPPMPVVPEQRPSPMAQGEPPDDVARTITVSRPLATGGSPEGAGAADGVPMDAVDRAIIQAFKAHWLPPPGTQLDPDKSSVLMDVDISRSGVIQRFVIVQGSGDPALDDSVRQTGNRIQSIGMNLPPAFRGDRYKPRLNFHAE
jgi:hypothetical protein